MSLNIEKHEKNRNKNSINIYDIIVCPECKKKLIINDFNSLLTCNNCGLEYPIVNNVPMLLRESAKQIK